MLPEVSIIKIIYSLSTGMPPIERSIFRGWVFNRRRISCVNSCMALASWPSIMFCTWAVSFEAANWPLIFDRSPCSLARRIFSSDSCSFLAVKSRLRITVSPLISTSSSSSRTILDSRSSLISSMIRGSANLDNTNSRMTAPNPQQIQSKKDKLNICMSLRFFFTILTLRLRQSF